jgi:hypothetical protein
MWNEGHFFFLWLYSPILGLGRLHETFRFISVTRCRTVGRTPWTGDQLVARTLLTDRDNDEVGGMNGFGRGNQKYSEKTCPDATLTTTNPTCQTQARTRAAAVRSQRLTASAMARPGMRGVLDQCEFRLCHTDSTRINHVPVSSSADETYALYYM